MEVPKGNDGQVKGESELFRYCQPREILRRAYGQRKNFGSPGHFEIGGFFQGHLQTMYSQTLA